MRSAVVVDAVRSPMARGRAGGALADLHPVDLLGQVLTQLLDRVDVDPGLVEDVIVGTVSQVADQSGPPGRWAWLAAGLPEHVPSTTVDRRCGSGQQAAHFGAQGIIAGAYDVVVVAGVESMSRVPMGSARREGDPFGSGVTARYAPGLVPQGISSELVAARWDLDRELLDEYAERSHARAWRATEAGAFDAELVPVVVTHADGSTTTLTADETIRPSTTSAGLAALQPAFRDESWSSRFPELRWSTTAGNSSQLTDGASAMLLMSDTFASRLNVRPLARFHSFAVAGSDPLVMLMGTVPATRNVLVRAGLALDDIDHVEVNEAFATVPLAWGKELRADWDRINPLGGAISLGHPLGASGCRLMTTMVHALDSAGGRYGLQTMCEAGGMANATVLERLS